MGFSHNELFHHHRNKPSPTWCNHQTKGQVKGATKSHILWISSLFLLFSCQVMPDSMRPSGLHHVRPSCASLSPGVYSNSRCHWCLWCHPTISSSITPFSCLQSFPASGSFPMCWLFTSGGQSVGVLASASVKQCFVFKIPVFVGRRFLGTLKRIFFFISFLLLFEWKLNGEMGSSQFRF